MKRQNSIPQPLRPAALNSHHRKCSHDSLQYSDTNTISIPGGLTSLTQQENYNHKNDVLSPILVTDLGNSSCHSLKRVTLTEETAPLPESLSPVSSMHTITFGWASPGTAHFRKISADCESGASTSRPIENNGTEMTEMDIVDEHQTGLFFLRMADGRSLPIYCHQPVGEQADHILHNINARFKEKLRKFIEQDKPQDGENYVWIQSDRNGKSTVLSLRQLENHFNSAQVKRVKWRYSLGTTIYRYSVPIITTKFRLRIMHFLSQNYRCCILFVWCFVILFISVGIVLSVIFGSTPYMNSSLRRNMTTTYILQR
uniref:Uncharacterized protein n=1 Tax=Panagrolaimus superbus TaxID=310955 RepID=A0A914XPY7_9BILA